MLDSLLDKISTNKKLASFSLGVILNFAFAPFFIWPLNIVIPFFIFIITKANSKSEAALLGWLFGFGFYLANLYWITIGVGVYIAEFWWALPFSLTLLPAYLACYFAILSFAMYLIKDKNFFINSFVCFWVVIELLRSKLLTGFPWSLIAYSFSFSDIIIQVSSIIGSYGLGAIIIFSFSSLFYLLVKNYKKLAVYSSITITLWIGIFYYGKDRLDSLPTENTEIKIRLVQPSVVQTDKWSLEKFWQNFAKHKKLSSDNRLDFRPDLIIWPEAAVVLEPKYAEVLSALRSVVVGTKSILVTGGVTDNLSQNNRKKDKIFASIYAIKATGNLLFDYHKSHLVPFGEYVPYSDILPINKITPGLLPYSPGKPGFIVSLEELGLKIRPLLCYEIIFPDEVRMNNRDADLILNLTNDAYYGNSSGPYQHFYIAKMRAVENGLPLVRVANNGISSIIDPVGRVLVKSSLNSVVYIDSFLPYKLSEATLYSLYGNKLVFIYILVSFILVFLLPRKEILQ